MSEDLSPDVIYVTGEKLLNMYINGDSQTRDFLRGEIRSGNIVVEDKPAHSGKKLNHERI